MSNTQWVINKGSFDILWRLQKQLDLKISSMTFVQSRHVLSRICLSVLFVIRYYYCCNTFSCVFMTDSWFSTTQHQVRRLHLRGGDGRRHRRTSQVRRNLIFHANNKVLINSSKTLRYHTCQLSLYYFTQKKWGGGEIPFFFFFLHVSLFLHQSVYSHVYEILDCPYFPPSHLSLRFQGCQVWNTRVWLIISIR